MNMVELSNLPLADKLQAMEVLWESLCRDTRYDPSPAWHAEVLAQRALEIQEGTSVSWIQAKAELSHRSAVVKDSLKRA